METKEVSFLEKIMQSVAVKLIMILVLTLIMLIPMHWISELIEERKYREQEVNSEIALKWGKQQVIGTPVLAIPYTKIADQISEKKIQNTEVKVIEKVKLTEWIFLLPNHVKIDSKVSPEPLKRGIYKVVVYNTKLNISGDFDSLNLSKLKIDPADVNWDQARVVFGVEDFKGLKATPQFTWKDQKLELEPDFNNLTLFSQSLTAPVAIANEKDSKQNFNISFDLKGSKSLNFLPLAAQTDISISGNWSNPSFNGAFLPEDRQVGANNFSAKWSIPSFSRKLPQSWTGTAETLYKFYSDIEETQYSATTMPEPTSSTTYTQQTLTNDDMVSVNFLPEVNQYQKTTRVAKYGILVILLTFTALLFTEIVKKQRIHIIQYILIGAAMALFYSLLLALSEQMGFNIAYVLAALATVGLIAVFIKGITKDNKTAAIFAGILSTFYVFIYVLMQLRDLSLIVGTIGMFVILAVLMRLSTKINWYQFDNK
ncbi:cell envelope integrity protein CreD [Sphingobacterium spiritivorum]|uniref:cell envelope integrity protein CreD n=1 Tax=Sphingobacterium spiritivorum TaxID=258 RepID=UPI00191AEA06|nr:cell envelope integrity protein CreD [Sphingobacterium spiritivorum]QQT24290.1 cell envelope integrity protein CreD [Sphingobacterium spiritivorum]